MELPSPAARVVMELPSPAARVVMELPSPAAPLRRSRRIAMCQAYRYRRRVRFLSMDDRLPSFGTQLGDHVEHIARDVCE
jgi:hypothetical protein